MSSEYKLSKDSLAGKEKRLRFLYLVLSLSCFGVGSLVYLLFRTTDLYMFVPLKMSGIYEPLIALRKSLVNVILPDWIIYNLSDGLWLFAYMLLIESIWWLDSSHGKAVFLYSLPVFAVVVEVGQMLHCFPGTGDWLDITAYIIAIFLFIILKNQNLWTKQKYFFHLWP